MSPALGICPRNPPCESGGQIHRNYNGWVQNLTRNINVQLAAS